MGVRTARIKGGEAYRQSGFFDEDDYDKLSRLDETIDDIRNCFGMDAVKRAVFLGQSIDHMSGGISREKRSVDYDKEEIQ